MTDDDTTTSPLTRWEYTNDVVTLLIVLTFVGTWGAGLYALVTGRLSASAVVGGVPDPVAYALAAGILMMFVWLYGDGAAETLLRLRGGS